MSVEEILGGEREAGKRSAGCTGDPQRQASDERAGQCVSFPPQVDT